MYVLMKPALLAQFFGDFWQKTCLTVVDFSSQFLHMKQDMFTIQNTWYHSCFFLYFIMLVLLFSFLFSVCTYTCTCNCIMLSILCMWIISYSCFLVFAMFFWSLWIVLLTFFIPLLDCCLLWIFTISILLIFCLFFFLSLFSSYSILPFYIKIKIVKLMVSSLNILLQHFLYYWLSELLSKIHFPLVASENNLSRKALNSNEFIQKTDFIKSGKVIDSQIE